MPIDLCLFLAITFMADHMSMARNDNARDRAVSEDESCMFEYRAVWHQTCIAMETESVYVFWIAYTSRRLSGGSCPTRWGLGQSCKQDLMQNGCVSGCSTALEALGPYVSKQTRLMWGAHNTAIPIHAYSVLSHRLSGKRQLISLPNFMAICEFSLFTMVLCAEMKSGPAGRI